MENEIMNKITLSIELPDWMLVVFSLSVIIWSVLGIYGSYLDYQIKKEELRVSEWQLKNK